MLTGFFLHLKAHKLPVSTRELLTLLEALEARVVSLSIDDFYTLSRACFVKDEQHFEQREELERRYPDLLPLTVSVDWEKAHGAGRIDVKFRPGASGRSAAHALLAWQDWRDAGRAQGAGHE